MADFEKVYSINYDVTKALENLRKLEKALISVDTRSRELFQNKGVLADVAAPQKRADRERVRSAKRAEAEKTRNAKQAATERTRISQRAEKEQARAAKAAAREAARIERQRVRDVQQSTRRKIQWAEREVRERIRIERQAQREAATIERQRVRVAQRAARQISSARRKAADETLASLKRLASRAAIAGAAIAGLGIRAVTRSFQDFDQAATSAAAKFSRLEPELRPGTEGFRNFEREIRNAGAGTEHSAAQVARAFDFWAKAGKTSEQTKAVINSTLDFASANQDASGAMLDVSRAGDILSDTLGQFRLNTNDPAQLMENTARVADVMSAAANRANFSAEELFESFTSAGPTLSAVGSDIEETASLLAAMANAGIKGAAAGTQLKMSIANLSALTGPQEAALNKLGVAVKDSDGNFRGLTTIIRDLNEATKDMGTADRFQVFAKAVGRRAIPSFINLLAEGKTNLDAMTESLRGTKGEANNLAVQMRQSASAQIETFKNRLMEVGFQLVDKTNLFGRLTAALNSVDFDALSKMVTDDFIPALKKAGQIVTEIVIPALQRTWRTLSVVLGPAIKVITSLFGGLSEGGGTLAKIIGDLITLWIAYKGYLLATKAVDMAGWFVQLARSVTAAGTAQTALATKSAAANASLAAGVKQVGLLRAAMGVLTAFVVGWEIGTILHDKLVEPMMRARDEAKKLRAEFEDSKSKEGEKSRDSRGVMTSDLDIARKQLAAERKDWEAVRVEQRAIGEDLPEKSKRMEEIEAYIKRLEGRIEQKNYLASTEENIRKYGSDTTEGAAPQQSEDLQPWELPEPTIPRPIIPMPDTPVIPGIPVPQVPEISVPTIGPVDGNIVENITAAVELQRGPDSDALNRLVELQAESIALQETRAAETRASEERRLSQSVSESKQVNNNVEVGPTTIKIEATGASFADVKRAADTAVKDAGNAVKRGVQDGLRSVGPSEI